VQEETVVTDKKFGLWNKKHSIYQSTNFHYGKVSKPYLQQI